MYIPSSFAEEDVSKLHAFVEAHPLATLVTAVGGSSGMFGTHLPLLLDRSTGPFGRLVGHIARANPHAKQLAAGTSDALVIFSGPDAYITPNWYATKAESGRVVPTWNYVAVHAYGKIALRGEPEFLRSHLEMLVRTHEPSRAGTWEVSDAPADYITQQLRAIVGVEITIERLEGKWKMSQNRTAADIEGVVSGLSSSSLAEDHVVAALVAERRPMNK